jgi:hypothetical protein
MKKNNRALVIIFTSMNEQTGLTAGLLKFVGGGFEVPG